MNLENILFEGRREIFWEDGTPVLRTFPPIKQEEVKKAVLILLKYIQTESTRLKSLWQINNDKRLKPYKDKVQVLFDRLSKDEQDEVITANR